jgi:protein O-mannosyl-transferase
LSIFGTIIEILKANKIPYPMSKKNKTVKSVSPAMPQNDTQALNTISATPKDNTTLWFYGAIAFLVIITFVAFSGGFDNEFVDWDDQNYVTTNPLVKNPTGQWNKALNSHVGLNYHPLTMLSLMVNSAIWGIETARSFVVTNTIIHLLNVLLVFWFVLLLLKNQSETQISKSGKPFFLAFVTALFFAIHPMRVESVTWVSERKDVLYVFFFIAACINYLKYIDSDKQRKYLFYSFLLFLASCLSKGQAVVLPIVFLLLDYWRDRKWTQNVLIEKIPFLAISLLFGLIAVNIQSGGDFGGLIHVEGIAGTAVKNAQKGTIFRNMLFAGYGFLMYCFHLLLPIKLSSFYPYRNPSESHPEYLLGLFILIGFIVIGIFNYRRNKIVTFGITFFMITIALVLQLLQVGDAIMADRYTYLPYLGLLLIISTFLWKLFQKSEILKSISIGIIFCAMILCVVMTRNQVETWQDTEALFSQRIKIEPDDTRGYVTLAGIYRKKENLDGVITNSNLAIEKGWKENIAPWLNLAVAYDKQGNYAKALEYYNYVIQKEPTAESYSKRGSLFLNIQQPYKALPDLEKAIKMPKNEDLVSTRGALANAQLNTGQIKEALENYNIVIDKDKSLNPEYFYNRGAAKSQLKDISGAIEDIKICVKLKPDHEKGLQAMKLFGIK